MNTAPVASVPASSCLGEEIGESVRSLWGPASSGGRGKHVDGLTTLECPVRGVSWPTHTPSPLLWTKTPWRSFVPEIPEQKRVG